MLAQVSGVTCYHVCVEIFRAEGLMGESQVNKRLNAYFTLDYAGVQLYSDTVSDAKNATLMLRFRVPVTERSRL